MEKRNSENAFSVPELFLYRHMVELKLAAEMAVITDEIGGFFQLHIEDFSDGQCFMGLEGSVFHLFQEDTDAFGFVQHVSNGRESVGMIHRIIPEGKGFLDVDDGINPETGDALVQPPVDHFIELLAKLRILPVEIRLTFVEHMEIIELIVTRNRFPYGAAEIGATSWSEAFRRGLSRSRNIFHIFRRDP